MPHGQDVALRICVTYSTSDSAIKNLRRVKRQASIAVCVESIFDGKMEMADKKHNHDTAPFAASSGMGRRPFLLGSLASIGAAAISAGCGKASPLVWPKKASVSLQDYRPVSFNTVQWQFLLAACDRIIPSDSEGPGALDAHVPVFIDLEMATPYGQGEDWYMEGPFDPHASPLFGYQMPFNLATLYKKGIDLSNAYTQKTFGKLFKDLPTAKQEAVLSDLEHSRIDFAALGEPDLTAGYFFFRLLDNSREGYLSDPQYGGNKDMAAWVMLNFPGARASFPEWVTMHNAAYPLKPVALDGTQA